MSNIDKQIRKCDNCQQIKKIKTCAWCKKAYYCSKECQVQHWKVHKKLCKKKKKEENNKKEGIRRKLPSCIQNGMTGWTVYIGHYISFLFNGAYFKDQKKMKTIILKKRIGGTIYYNWFQDRLYKNPTKQPQNGSFCIQTVFEDIVEKKVFKPCCAGPHMVYQLGNYPMAVCAWLDNPLLREGKKNRKFGYKLRLQICDIKYKDLSIFNTNGSRVLAEFDVEIE